MLNLGESFGDPARSWAALLNERCHCSAVSAPLLADAFGDRGISAAEQSSLLGDRPHLFSDTMVFVSPEQVASIGATIEAIERLAALPAWQSDVLSLAPDIATHRAPTRSVFMGYDFHLAEDQPQLIEVNTNAGGAFLSALLTRSQLACCREVEPLMRTPTDLTGLEDRWIGMFRAEWQLARGNAPLRHIAIVDEAPSSQFLYPEFLLFKTLFERHGLQASIVAPEELTWHEGRLICADMPVDLVYNRLTDFYLESLPCAALRAAYLAGAVVLTPSPRAHALLADKRHLVRFCDDVHLTQLGLDLAGRTQLRGTVPYTHVVRDGQPEALWLARKDYFFKPATGFGSRAAYRGDKLTRRVWGEILSGDYVAQRIAPPAIRHTKDGADAKPLKFDVRAYTYAGEIQLMVARLYDGQTTNFRTPGGGFAPVFVTPEASLSALTS